MSWRSGNTARAGTARTDKEIDPGVWSVLAGTGGLRCTDGAVIAGAWSVRYTVETGCVWYVSVILNKRERYEKQRIKSSSNFLHKTGCYENTTVYNNNNNKRYLMTAKSNGHRPRSFSLVYNIYTFFDVCQKPLLLQQSVLELFYWKLCILQNL